MNWKAARSGSWNALSSGVIEGTPLGLAFAIIHGETVVDYVGKFQIDKNLDCRNVQPSTWKRLGKEWNNRPLLTEEWSRKS